MSQIGSRRSRAGGLSRALARDRLGVPAVLFFVLAGTLLLLAVTSVVVVAFFARGSRGESAWRRLVAPLLAVVVLAIRNYATLLGVPPGDPAASALPASYAVVAVLGLGWGLVLQARKPELYSAIGLGAQAVTTRLTAADEEGSR